ncbi:hypothetical protein [Methylocystis sp. WRRC1]|uniref:hypothetical protein n=1 Tax=Methylocystis sp. WRRC1 TaxID=1732014 RepID=UPI001D14C5FF|nr:hypothetical protein [Methylocystis sp. WRRC1]
MGRSTASISAARAGAKHDAAPPSVAPQSNEDTAALAGYIADMTAELAKLAGGSQMPMLAYFLNLARVEAEIRARELGGAPIKRG